MAMDGEGMVAVVRGLRDAGLAVTLMDAGRQYTLVPDIGAPPRVNACQTTGSQCSCDARRENGIQATDGRYASMYKMVHCHITPTSPPDLVTEFPPQRAELCPGHGNFEVGGLGSGESYCLPTKCSDFRGAMCWSDRGSVFSPRASLQDDLFASSLRKYPSLIQDRSSEMVERLINFTQTKNSLKNRPTTSPGADMESDASSQTVVGRNQRYGAEKDVRTRRTEESPTKERARRVVEQERQENVSPCWRRCTFSKTSDVRYLRDVSKKMREGIRNLSSQSNNQAERTTRGRLVPACSEQRSVVNQCSTNTVNMEIQAAVQMVSREVVTVPREAPPQRTVAVPLASTSSLVATHSHCSVSCSHNVLDSNKIRHGAETAQTKLNPVDTNVQNVSSAVEIGHQKLRNRKRSKSQEEIRLQELMKDEILDLMLPLYSSCAKKRPCRKYQNRSNKNNVFSFKIDDENRTCYNSRERTFECGFSKAESKLLKKSLAKIFHAEVNPYKIKNEDALTKLLDDWINLIPLKGSNAISMSCNKEYLFYDLFEYLNSTLWHTSGPEGRGKLKSEIINRLATIPLDVRGHRLVFENRLADILVNKLKRMRNKQTHHFLLEDDTHSVEDVKSFGSALKRADSPSKCEVKSFVFNKLLTFLKRWELKLNQREIKGIEDELTEILLVSKDLLHCAKHKHLKMDIIELLVDYGISEDQAIIFSNTLLRNFKNIYIDKVGPDQIRSETFFVLSNTKNVTTGNSFSIQSINEDDNRANLESYTNDLCRQIDEWLTQLPISIPQDKAFRRVVINDLAGDIVDRLRYVDLDPGTSTSEEAELEHLKYQIFKWINKLIAEDNLDITKYAPDLMRRIKDIPVPMLSRLNDLNSSKVSNKRNTNRNDNRTTSPKQFTSLPLYDKTLPNNQEQLLFNVTEERCMNPSCTNDENRNTSLDTTNPYEKTIKDLEKEYEQYVKDWVKLIPIEAHTPEEQAIAEKARLGIHNGLWKVVSKLNCDPATYYDRFFYEDLLDEGIEDLLDCLPQIPELVKQKYLLKVRFIEKTTDINEMIKVNEEASYKHNLMKNMFNNLRTQGFTNFNGDDPLKVHQDMQVKKIVEEFLLCTNYENDDKVKAKVYKKKLFKHIDDFIEDLKKQHPQQLKDVDISTYKTDIINILLKVRSPCAQIIKQEADSILLDLEIEQWYNDLPIVPSDDFKQQYQRSKQREMLANIVKEFEKNNSQLTEDALRVEVSKFLEKMPLKEGETLNIPFILEQFVNRIKNRPRQQQKAFDTLPNYEDFGKEISFCSSYINAPKAPVQTQPQGNNMNKSRQCSNLCSGQVPNASLNFTQGHNVSSKSATNKSRVVIQEPPAYRTFNEGRPLSASYHPNENSPQWLSLEGSTIPNIQNPPNLQDQNMFDIPLCCSPEQVRQQMDFKMASDNENRNPERIKTSRGILGTSQIAGPSGYSSRTPQNVNGNIIQPQVGGGHYQLSGRSDISRTKVHTEQIPPRLDECSISCQTFGANKSRLQIGDLENREDNQMHVATNTSAGNKCCDPSMYSYITKKDAFESELRGSSSRGVRLPSPGREPGKPSGVFEDDDDDIPCRCIERFWRRARRRYNCEALDNLPPCFSLMFPYPYFL